MMMASRTVNARNNHTPRVGFERPPMKNFWTDSKSW